MKKLIALVIVAVMLLGMMPMMAMAAETQKIYFRNDWNWSEIKVHYWGDNGSTNWPGVAMTKSGEQHNNIDVYYADIPVGTTGVVFNGNKDTGGTDQSPDVTDVQTGVCYYMHWDNGNKCNSFSYTPSGSGNQGGGGEQEPTDYYLVGHINGADNYGADYKFTNGTLTTTLTGDGSGNNYVQIKDSNGTVYGTEEYCQSTTGTMKIGGAEKMLVPSGEVTFTLVENNDDTLTLSYTVSAAQTKLEYNYISVAGNGNSENGWVNGVDFNPAESANKMTETSEDVWEITFKSVSAGDGYQVKFAADGAWTTNWGGDFGGTGAETDASVNGSNITFSLTEVSNVTLKLDLTNYNATTKQGAKFTITIVPAPVVSFNYNYAGAPEASTDTVDANGKVSAPTSIPTRAGWALVGWYKNVDCTGNAVNFDTDTFTENTTLFAKWSENEHTVKLHNNDGTDAVTSVATSDEKMQLPVNNPERANYTFKEWNTKADGTGTKYVGGEPISDDLDLYAIWEQKPTYTVSFDLNYEGATGAPEAKSTIDGKIELPAASRTGYTFNGWYTAKTEGTKVDNDKVYEANTTLYAQWTKVEYVTVHASVPETWTTAFVYAWNTGAGSNEAWPGAPMTKGTDGWFTAQVPVGYGNLIIAEKDGGEQTKDLTGINQTATEIWVTLTEKEGDKYKADVTYPSDINTDPSEYYLHGYINGADVTGTTYKFVDGKVTVNLTAESYVFVGTDIGSNFMTDGWLGKEVKEATLATDYATSDKLFVPAGNVTFTLVVNDDGTVKLSYAVAAPEGGNQGGTEGGNQGGNQSGTAGNPEAPAGGTEGGSEVEEITINVKVPADWENPCLWAWQENGDNDINAFDAWPGMALTKGENGWYYAKVPANMNYMIVNAHNGAWQTPDTAIEKSKCDVWAEVVVDAAGQATIKMQYTSPATGDTAIIAPVVFLMVMSVTGLALLTVGKKKYF